MCGETDLISVPDPAWPNDEPVLSGRLTVLRSGLHLAQIAQGLRDLETIMISVELSGETMSGQDRCMRRSRLQALDLMIQELMGLSDILIGAASHLSDAPDATIDALVDMPRLQSLTRALRDYEGKVTTSEVVLF